jgi:hypothetical protein
MSNNIEGKVVVITGAGEYPDDAAQADRRLRSADRARRFHGLPARGVTSTRVTSSNVPGGCQREVLRQTRSIVVELLLATSEAAASELNGCFEDASSRGQRSAGRKWPSELQNSRSSSGPSRLSAGFRSIL